ncbi:MAG: serine hydrolase [Bacteroidetes bacterium]|nr:serine hydrolase [Bacteroidota bacterium]
MPALAAFDSLIPDVLAEHDVPGAAVAVAYEGRLVFARGYGLADTTTGELVQPFDMFRIASVSKPITAVAVARLVEEGHLDLDAHVFGELLTNLEPLPGETADARLNDITVRDLLYHTAGWDAAASGDPMFMTTEIAQAAGTAMPPSQETIIRYVMSRPLDFEPGSAYVYSNFGYLLLGRVIEHVTGRTYQAYVTELLAEADIERLALARSRFDERLDHEVRYYMPPGTPPGPSVFTGEPVPQPYGNFYIEAMDAHGGWVTTAPDLLRFATAVDGDSSRPDILQPETIQQMLSDPGAPAGGGGGYQGMGWYTFDLGGGDHFFSHDGSLPGTTAFLAVNTRSQTTWVALANGRSNDITTFAGALNEALVEAVNSVTAWPSHDFFDQFTPVEATPAVPTQFNLELNYPNPFNPQTTIGYVLPEASAVRLVVYDVLGRRVAVLVDGVRPAGRHQVTFEAANLPSGVYLYRLDAGAFTQTKRMLLVK